MAKGKGDSGPLFFLCPVARRLHYRDRADERARHRPIVPTGRMRHRKGRYGRNHQDEFRCACGLVFWTNFYHERCPDYRSGEHRCPGGRNGTR